MNTPAWVVLMAKVLLTTAAIPTTLFPLLYLRSPWFRSWLGRATMVQSIVLAILIDFSWFRTFFADVQNRLLFLWINVGIVILITVTSSLLTYLLWMFQHRRRAYERNPHGGPRHAPADEGNPHGPGV